MRACSGECGYEIGPGVVACIGCWKRLPLDLKRAVWTARKAADIAASIEAVHDIFMWLHANPAKGKDLAKK